jgi:hypothetical protein
MTNIPNGYTDEGERGVSKEQAEWIEHNWESIGVESVKKCYQCNKPLRVLNVIGGRYVCEDCIAELNLK